MRILIVEDEVRLADTLRRLLHRSGYSADVCHDGAEGLDNALSGIYDLLVLDVMLPKMDGLTLLRTLRAQGSTVPVLMLTAKSELQDRVTGLDSGADYYLTKPFEAEELLACVRSLLRRGESTTVDALRWEDLTLEQGTFQLLCGERSVRLSRKEYDLMALLLQNGQQVVSKEQILLKIWGYDSAAEENSVEVYISFLRRKLSHLHSRVRIKTLRMVGYCLEVGS
ncbi:MAG: response regulator transcription factor [Oscillospiraceae bacterium]|nr:response regulator transcription factor [Oscillospiraceae bacterium]